MFGKIKGKLKDVFKKSEDEIFDEKKDEEKLNDFNLENIEKEENKENKEKEIQEDLENENEEKESKESQENSKDELEEETNKKKGFFSKVFSKNKKDKEEIEEIENVEDVMLEKVDENEKNAIKNHKDLSENKIQENKLELEKKIVDEQVQEKKEFENIDLKNKEILDENNLNLNQDLENENEEKESEEFQENKDELEEETNKKKGFFSKTLSKLSSKKITDEDFDKIWLELEIFLLEINIAYEIVEKIREKLFEQIIEKSFNRFDLFNKIRDVLVYEISLVLKLREDNFEKQINKILEEDKLVKILILGVNGSGKTTTIAKIVNFLKEKNLKVVVSASDTFRAAAVEQLDEHSKNLNFKLIKHSSGSDPSAVAFDAIEHAKAKNLDVVLIDTAGRMPNNSNLMQEISKIKRVTKSQFNIFIGDSVSGNDLIEQIEIFDKIVGIDGVILTKTDTDEKPGSIVSASYKIEKPIFFLGTGQNYSDLVKFDANLIAKKLFDLEK